MTIMHTTDNLTRSAAAEYRQERAADAMRRTNGASAARPASIAVGVASANETPRPAPVASLVRASDLKPKPIDWLWPGWLAAGKLHVCAGQPGTGKTTLAMRMAATVSQGSPWPDGRYSKAGNVIIWSGEDDPADTLAPRLAASGADMNRVFFVSDVLESGQKRPFDPAKDITCLQAAIAKAGGARLIVVDPIVSAVAADTHKNGETRRALQPLVDLASNIGAALLGITHLSKGTAGREPIERVTGSLAFGALARVVLIAAKEGDGGDSTPGRRILMRAKSNIGPDEGGFAYELRQEPMPQVPDIIASIAVFGEAVEGTARDALATAEALPEDNGAAEDAEFFLRDSLALGPVSVRELKAAAEAHGHSWRTVERAKKRLGVMASKAGLSGGWSWSLAEDRHEDTKTATSKTWRPSEDLAAFGGKDASPVTDDGVEI